MGCNEGGVSSLELEEGGSPPGRPSPPATPAPQPELAPPSLARSEPLELQLDYWLVRILLLAISHLAGGGRPSPPCSPSSSPPPLTRSELLELQLDYWLMRICLIGELGRLSSQDGSR